MGLNLNDTYTMLQVLAQTYPPTTLLRDTFFPEVVTSPTNKVLMDYKKGGRELAPFIVKGSKGTNVARGGFVTKEYEPPMMAPKRPISISDLEKRSFNENIFTTITPEQRAMKMRADDLADLVDMNTRRVEWMCAELLTKGQIVVKGYADDGKTAIQDTITYADWDQKLILSGADVWTNTASDIYGQLQEGSKVVARNSGRVPEVAIASYATCGRILKNASIMEFLMVPNAQNLSLMSIQPKIITSGVTRIGYIQSLNLEIYAYDGIYTDEAGVIQQYIPDGYFIMGVKGRGKQVCAAITQLEQGTFKTYEGQNVPKVWNDEDSDTQMIRVASKCIPKPEYINDWYTIKAY